MKVYKAKSRVHCGLLNESGLFDRVDGGIGFTLDDPSFEFSLTKPGTGIEFSCHVSKDLIKSIEACFNSMEHEIGRALPGINVIKSIPIHIGLGSKTAILGTIVRSVFERLNKPLSDQQLCELSGRGGTSGIGINSFQSEGFLWDMGKPLREKSGFSPSSLSVPKRLNSCVTLSANWLKCVHLRFDEIGISGKDESDFFQKNCPIPEQEAMTSLALVSGSLVPSILERDEILLNYSLGQLQNLGLKKREWEIQGNNTKLFRSYWKSLNSDFALCLSSVGPTVFVITSKPDVVLSMVGDYEGSPVHICVSDIV
ncbi:beta-ribofuranosylaminobenzene 5'-phosphate synthase family protein [Teredinibacter turnerae]|uniref:beta-ribofuranosylaminobenzene 5'-phosphate synthase family protein n=1 Tax=Teredinibacter turnerae TaxID=2426 RepID=UPI00035FC80C|nr:beta-ribofuranosylaminobenzene 5'-phosphate synthase family protein [Teredinibacter turnerae]